MPYVLQKVLAPGSSKSELTLIERGEKTDAKLQDGLWQGDVQHVVKKSFQAFVEKRLPQAVAETMKRELIVAETGSGQDERIKKLVLQSLSTAFQEYESENSEQPGGGDRPSYSTRSMGSASVDFPYSSNISLFPEDPSLPLGEYWTCFTTTDSPMYSFPEGTQE